ncbi:fungal-specific transcription factor domain-containing protein [Massariosphaeria phaeospora]|uniref:Fungal-specific transcription factor domain-containing protein n=1 Tax=Massariosphaeria phaeospora TaxID=100035 RepID=A0A7C8MW66_9PLEO|nr:fungal-specific transcription factor domain-containing protein [Massariosphaeria phaeospora]
MSTPMPCAPPSTTATATTTTSHSRRVPLDKRKRTETSCDKCKSRKQKCRREPGQDACRYCMLHHIECLATQPRKKRLYGSVEGIGNRLALLESLVKGFLPDADVSNLDELRQIGLSLGFPVPDAAGAGAGADCNGESANNSGSEAEEPPSLFPDQQGQVQYIGPASSFSFHLKLRTLVGQGTIKQFVLFGSNAADQGPIEVDGESQTLSPPRRESTVDHYSPVDQPVPANETSNWDLLIAAYFRHINRDFPVLHEPSFRDAYRSWLADPTKADPAWLCSFSCVLLLSRRIARIKLPEDQERIWWKCVQPLLPVVVFTSSLMAVQALMLAALHLHNTNHRDACWNLTGTAIRIAVAIGLHQDRVNLVQTPLAREMQKQLWCTLYAFEQMQVSSYDRPSAIEHTGSKISCPNKEFTQMVEYSPPDYQEWLNRLVVHLASACRSLRNAKSHTGEEFFVNPLSPAAAVLRDLDRWDETLPSHLRIEAVDTSAQSFQRPLYLLHAKYHYTIIVLTRAAILARATTMSKEGKDSPNAALAMMADRCAYSGRALARILLGLESVGKFDPVTWWDVWYSLASASILVVDFVCLNQSNTSPASEPHNLLSRLADLATRHRRNPHMPGTIEKFASLVPELYAMVNSMGSQRSTQANTSRRSVPARQVPPQLQQDVTPFSFHHSSTNSGAFLFADNGPGRFYPEPEIAVPYSAVRFDRGAHMPFMDLTISSIQDWNWGDVGSLLGPDGVAHHGHVPGPV